MTDEPGKAVSKKAIWSLVLGIVGLTCLGCLAGVPAVICGHMAMAQVKRSAGMLTGEGLALAGLIMGYISMALTVFVLPIVLAISIPAFAKARAAGEKAACMNNLRIIQDTMNSVAMAKNLSEGAVLTEADLTPYMKNGMIPVCPAGGAYAFGKVGEEPLCSKHGSLSHPIRTDGLPDAAAEGTPVAP